MRATTFTKLILQGLTFMLLHALAPSAMAQEPTYQFAIPKDARADHRKSWICEYSREPDGVLYMRCDGMVSLMSDDLTLESDVRPSPTKYIPVWSTPKSEGKAIELAKMMLCNQRSPCSVEMASRTGHMRASLF